MSSPALERFDALAEILFHLPPGPFSLDNFLAHAIGLNAVSNVSEISPMLERLAELGLIRQVVETGDWVVVKQADVEDSAELDRR